MQIITKKKHHIIGCSANNKLIYAPVTGASGVSLEVVITSSLLNSTTSHVGVSNSFFMKNPLSYLLSIQRHIITNFLVITIIFLIQNNYLFPKICLTAQIINIQSFCYCSIHFIRTVSQETVHI